MPRGFKRDEPATEAAYFKGLLIDKKRRSFVSQPKIIDGEPYGPHLLLFGADKTAQRMKLFEREHCRCQTCHCVVVWGGDECEGWTNGMVGEWKHIRDKPWNKCDCLANAELSCHAHHQGPGTEHYKRRPRFTVQA